MIIGAWSTALVAAGSHYAWFANADMTSCIINPRNYNSLDVAIYLLVQSRNVDGSHINIFNCDGHMYLLVVVTFVIVYSQILYIAWHQHIRTAPFVHSVGSVSAVVDGASSSNGRRSLCVESPELDVRRQQSDMHV